MILRQRDMQPGDVSECVEMIAADPVLRQRYGKVIEHLGPALLRLLGSEALTSVVAEIIDESPVRICFFGASLRVSDDFIRDLKSPPLFWIGPELTRRVISGQSPVLSDKQVRELNSWDGGGLNLVVWERCTRQGLYEKLQYEIVRVFAEKHRGFLWKELISSQQESAERMRFILETGGFLWVPDEARYVEGLDKDLEDIVTRPHVLGVTRELERQRPGSWIGSIFNYQPPRCGFSRSERRLLLAALEAGTDQELSEFLAVSLWTVKKTWLSVYGRVSDRLPALIPYDSTDSELLRGKEKRRRLLAYLRDHPEELRPAPSRFR